MTSKSTLTRVHTLWPPKPAGPPCSVPGPTLCTHVSLPEPPAESCFLPSAETGPPHSPPNLSARLSLLVTHFILLVTISNDPIYLFVSRMSFHFLH